MEKTLIRSVIALICPFYYGIDSIGMHIWLGSVKQ